MTSYYTDTNLCKQQFIKGHYCLREPSVILVNQTCRGVPWCTEYSALRGETTDLRVYAFLRTHCNRQSQADHTATYYKGGTRKGVMKKKLGYKNKEKHGAKKKLKMNTCFISPLLTTPPRRQSKGDSRLRTTA